MVASRKYFRCAQNVKDYAGLEVKKFGVRRCRRHVLDLHWNIEYYVNVNAVNVLYMLHSTV